MAKTTIAARLNRYEFLTPELFLLKALDEHKLEEVLIGFGGREGVAELKAGLAESISELESVPEDVSYEPDYSSLMTEIIEISGWNVNSASKTIISLPHILKALLEVEQCDASFLLSVAIDDETGEFLSRLADSYGEDGDSVLPVRGNSPVVAGGDRSSSSSKTDWKNLVASINDIADSKNPLIGREEELERTIRTLCRKEKNNPLHIGEPGVGKTALVYGLARRIEAGDVPERLRGAKIYGLEIGTLIAGTAFRGDLEKRLKLIMDGARAEANAIIYIDEIHNLVGAGTVGDGSLDASNLLKPYLEAGDIRFIGSTTFDEFKRHFAKSKGLVRRFLQIEITEPSEDETIRILQQLKPNYEAFHGVTYLDEAIETAVRGSARHITDRFLPDKAIDIIDEAGAYLQMHRENGGEKPTVDKTLVSEILARISKVERLTAEENEEEKLRSLYDRISGRVFGQEEAVRAVSEAVMMAKAGLTDETKPLASLLFVGPTGVGKTEVAKVLADEMGVSLVRFDMSEYTEKHTVAKLIGSPAGYVGYDDGGLLTDAVKRSPDCVLLLDEIEKAHPDIYNILLQVMDYGRLTDNKGNTSDFRNVILIMTSNAGARYASRASLGFGKHVSAGSSMLDQVKKVFKPEFINRLSSTVVFNDMNDSMASLILDKKLNELRNRLSHKKVELVLSDEARAILLKAGITREYGAREIERVINSRLSPLLMRAILFGHLKNGGTATIEVENSEIILKQ